VSVGQIEKVLAPSFWSVISFATMVSIGLWYGFGFGGKRFVVWDSGL